MGQSYTSHTPHVHLIGAKSEKSLVRKRFSREATGNKEFRPRLREMTGEEVLRPRAKEVASKDTFYERGIAGNKSFCAVNYDFSRLAAG